MNCVTPPGDAPPAYSSGRDGHRLGVVIRADCASRQIEDMNGSVWDSRLLLSGVKPPDPAFTASVMPGGGYATGCNDAWPVIAWPHKLFPALNRSLLVHRTPPLKVVPAPSSTAGGEQYADRGFAFSHAPVFHGLIWYCQ